MKTLLTFIVTLVFVAGCATTAVDPADAEYVQAFAFNTRTKTNTAELAITRDSGFTGSACSMVFYVDSQRVATLYPSQKTELWLLPGNHVISEVIEGSICWHSPVTLCPTLSPNTRTFLRVGFNFKETSNITTTCTEDQLSHVGSVRTG